MHQFQGIASTLKIHYFSKWTRTENRFDDASSIYKSYIERSINGTAAPNRGTSKTNNGKTANASHSA